MERKEHETALEIADRARRHRFFSSLEFGGRLESLRWILEAARRSLDQQAQLHRQDLLTRYPAYDELAQQVEQVARPAQGDAAGRPRTPTVVRQQGRELERTGVAQPAAGGILREIAVRREPAGLVFPPLRRRPTSRNRCPRDTPCWPSSPPAGSLYGSC